MGLRGPGETQLESDRREIGRRITHLKRELEEVRQHRAQYRKRRHEEAIPVVALVGYTNAGKSTLLNAISGADVYAADQLFATLDPTTRRIALPGGREVLMTDTVGFIQKLPTALVAAFRATLEEIADADLLLHVIDITHDNAIEQAQTVMEVLEELGATEQPVISALNKIDMLPESANLGDFLTDLPNSTAISALSGQGLPELIGLIEQVLAEELVDIHVMIPYRHGELVALLHQRGVIESEEHTEEGTIIQAKVPAGMMSRFESFSLEGDDSDEV